MTQLEQQRSQAIPIGARLDSAQARVTRAKKATEASEQTHKAAAEQLKAARAEEKAAEDDYNELARQELMRTKEEEEEEEEGDEQGKTLEELFLKLGQEKQNLSEGLQKAIEEAAEKAKGVGTPDAKRRKKERYARGNTVERSPTPDISPTAPFPEPKEPDSPTLLDTRMIQDVEDLDDAAFGKEVRARMRVAQQGPYSRTEQ